MNIKILYLPIEVVARELDGKLFLAYEALARGYKIAIGRTEEIKGFAEHIGSGAYMHKDYGIRNFPYHNDQEKKQSYCFAALYEEGLVFLSKEAFLDQAVLADKSDCLDIVFTFGKNQREMTTEMNPPVGRKIEAVGNPRFDFLRPKFHSLFTEESNKLKKKWGEYILINTNFSWGNRLRSYKSGLLGQKKKKGLGINQQKYKKDLFEQYKKMLISISRKFPNINFVLRPHPGEDRENWKNALKGLKNVKVIFKGNVVNWILGAKAIVHTGCTTGIEAWAAKMPVIRYNPLGESSPYEADLPNRFGKYAASVEELEVLIDEILQGKNWNNFNEQIHIIKPFLESIDGELSAKRIMNHIDEVCNWQGDDNTDYARQIRKYLTIQKRIKIILKRVCRAILKQKQVTKFIIGNKKAIIMASRFQGFPGINSNHVKNFLSKISEIEDNSKIKSINIRQIGFNSYFLEKKKFKTF